jgi:hypothetical protein
MKLSLEQRADEMRRRQTALGRHQALDRENPVWPAPTGWHEPETERSGFGARVETLAAIRGGPVGDICRIVARLRAVDLRPSCAAVRAALTADDLALLEQEHQRWVKPVRERPARAIKPREKRHADEPYRFTKAADRVSPLEEPGEPKEPKKPAPMKITKEPKPPKQPPPGQKIPGVYYNPTFGNFYAQVLIEGKRRTVANRDTQDECYAALVEACQRHGVPLPGTTPPGPRKQEEKAA